MIHVLCGPVLFAALGAKIAYPDMFACVGQPVHVSPSLIGNVSPSDPFEYKVDSFGASSEGSLPSGMVFDSVNGAMYWTPRQSGQWHMTIKKGLISTAVKLDSSRGHLSTELGLPTVAGAPNTPRSIQLDRVSDILDTGDKIYIGSQNGVQIWDKKHSTFDNSVLITQPCDGGLALDQDAGVLYLAHKYEVHRIDLNDDGKSVTVVNAKGTKGTTGLGANGLSATIGQVGGLALHGGLLYISDVDYHVVRSLNLTSNVLELFVGKIGKPLAGTSLAPNGDPGKDFICLSSPRKIRAEADGLYIASDGGLRVLQVDWGPLNKVYTITGLRSGKRVTVDKCEIASGVQVSVVDMAVARDGRIFIADDTNHGVLVVEQDKTVCQVSGYNGKGFSFSGAAASAKLTHPLSLQLSDDERFLYVAHGGDARGANVVQKIDVTPCPSVSPSPQRGQWSLVGGKLVGRERLDPGEAFVSPSVQLSGPGKGERKVEIQLKIDKYSHVTFGITKQNATELVGVKCNHNVSAGVRSGFVLMPVEDGDRHVARVIRSGACPPLELGTRQHNVVCNGATKVEFVVNRRKPLTGEESWWKLGKLSVGGRPLLPGAWTEELEACGDVSVVVGVCSTKAGNGLELTEPPLIFPRTDLY